MAPKRPGFLAAFCKISGFRVAHALRVSLTLSQGCSAALGPADSEGLRLSAFRAPGFSVDDGAAGQVVKAR